MVDSKSKLACLMPAIAFLDAIKNYSDIIACKSPSTTFNKFTNLAKVKLLKVPLNCYVPTDKIGKNRVVSGTEAEHILKSVQHIDNNHYIDFLRSMPHDELESVSLDITIMRPLHSKPNQNTQISPHIQCFDTYF